MTNKVRDQLINPKATVTTTYRRHSNGTPYSGPKAPKKSRHLVFLWKTSVKQAQPYKNPFNINEKLKLKKNKKLAFTLTLKHL